MSQSLLGASVTIAKSEALHTDKLNRAQRRQMGKTLRRITRRSFRRVSRRYNARKEPTALPETES